MRMKRIVHVIDTGGTGGAEQVCLTLADRMRAHGFTPDVVVGWEGLLSQQLRALDIQCVALPQRGSFNCKFIGALVRHLHQTRAEIVCSHLFGASVYAAIAARLAGIPSVAVLHGHSDISPNERFLGLKSRLLAAGAKKLVCVSAQLAKHVQQTLRVPQSLCTVIHNGIDTDKFIAGKDPALRAKLGIARDAFLIGALGDIRPTKRYDILAEAARLLSQRGIAFHVVIAGSLDEPKTTELRELCARYQLTDRFHLIGWQPNPADFLRGLDCLVVTSDTEGFSLACIEAMCVQIPLIATRSGGPEEIIEDGVTGTLIPRGDSAALADALCECITNEAIRVVMPQRAREVALSRFGLDRMLESYAALFRTLLNDRSPSSS